jgi:hypothetical protein
VKPLVYTLDMEFDITVTRTWSEIGVIRVTAGSEKEARRATEEYLESLEGDPCENIDFDPDSLSIEEYEVETVTSVTPKKSVAEIIAQ